MSTASADFEHLLSEAVNHARANAPRAVDDLVRLSSNAAEAVANVTGGAAALELIPINLGEIATPTYHLRLRKVGSEAPASDLGVYRATEAGYPILRWYSRGTWESRPDKPDGQYHNADELELNFRWMVSDPGSRLVVLVTFFKKAPSSAGPAAGSP